MRLLIISHTAHYERHGQIVGWGPTVRELGYLAELFDEVVHIALKYPGAAPDSALPYSSNRLRLRLVEPAGGPGLADKVGIVGAYPRYAAVMSEELDRADAVHVRCPANISLLALWLLGRRRQPPYRWVKYAGNWHPDGPEAWSYTRQRRWLSANQHKGVVTVNGRWPQQPDHILSFNNPSLTREELEEGAAAAAVKTLQLPLELLFVGALNDAKGVRRVLHLARELQAEGVPSRLNLLGDGPDRPRYEQWAADNGLKRVHFRGWVPRQEVSGYAAAAHFILLPSTSSEGWPKVLSEAMAYGAVPITSDISSIPQILADSSTGRAFPAEDIGSMVAAIAEYVGEPAMWQAESRAGVAAAHQFSYQFYQAAVTRLFAENWGVALKQPSGMVHAEGGRAG